jgi:hypothetical protein
LGQSVRVSQHVLAPHKPPQQCWSAGHGSVGLQVRLSIAVQALPMQA